jgi:uncharacterized protein
MRTIDADTHVVETERTWESIDGAARAFRPQGVATQGPDGKLAEYWLIDGRLLPRRGFVDREATSLESREMLDVEARLRHMDQLGVDVHVLYPTSFLAPLTRRPEVELALTQAYNRWLAELCDAHQERLRWAAVLPLLSLKAAVQEMGWAREHGACAVFMRGMEGHRLLLSDPYFFPIYEEASRLDMAIGIHAGNGNFAVQEAAAPNGFLRNKLTVISSFHAILLQGLPARFPKLRIGFLETSAQWVPYLMHDLRKRWQKAGRQQRPDVLHNNRIYVACESDDDLPYVLDYSGCDNLVIGSDYGHSDTSSELGALRSLRDSGVLSEELATKILADNPARLYGL